MDGISKITNECIIAVNSQCVLCTNQIRIIRTPKLISILHNFIDRTNTETKVEYKGTVKGTIPPQRFELCSIRI